VTILPNTDEEATMGTTTTLPMLAPADAERLLREAAAYLMLVDAFRAQGVEPAWRCAGLTVEPSPDLPFDGADDSSLT
jgi:hypothetical protein